MIYVTPQEEVVFDQSPYFKHFLFNGRNRIEVNYGCYGWTRNGGKKFHAGIDVDTTDEDKHVYSTVSGKVITSTIITDKANLTWQWGNYVCIQDTEGYKHYFCHLASRAVQVSQVIKAGDIIGIMGITGNAYQDVQAEHVHYEVRKAPYGSSNSVDPTPWAGIPNKQGYIDETKNEGAIPMNDAIVRVGAMSAGDVKQFNTLFGEMKVAYVNQNGTLTTADYVSPAVQQNIKALAVSLGNIGYVIVSEKLDSTVDIAAAIAKVQAIKAQMNSGLDEVIALLTK